MDFSLLFTGVVIGFSIAAPVGPIGLLCIRRTLDGGWAAGFASGLGAATADAVYGCMAALGLGVVTAALAGAQFWLRLAGGLLLCAIGAQAMLARPAAAGAPAPGGRGLAGAYAVTFGLTLTNPMTILAYAAILTGAGASLAPGAGGGALLLIAGVFTGSALWWLLLSGATSLLRRQLSPGILPWINRAAGLLIFGFGLWVLRQLV